MRLAREWDLRFEKLYRTGALSKWYSSIGNEAVTIPAATAIEAGDALLTLHRDSGAILRYYLDPEQLFPGWVTKAKGRKRPGGDSLEHLYRLACQMLGKRDGLSGGYERSYHYGFFDEPAGLIHIGMISHLGSMIPVAAGAALAFQQRGSDRVALNFVGEGATSTGDFHEGLNMAAVLRLPLILIIENNQYAFSTPAREQFVAESLATRAEGYGIPGFRVNGNNVEEVWPVVREAVARARRGAGPTLIEAVVGRLRGHSEGDDSLDQVSAEDQQRYILEDPVTNLELSLLERELVTPEQLGAVQQRCHELLTETVDRAQASPEPDPQQDRQVYAE
ncbi:MAG: thiamine pyrophosphate-dependent dehydrogenase E1 component subunit alpha [Planctomycetota bacterium]